MSYLQDFLSFNPPTRKSIAYSLISFVFWIVLVYRFKTDFYLNSDLFLVLCVAFTCMCVDACIWLVLGIMITEKISFDSKEPDILAVNFAFILSVAGSLGTLIFSVIEYDPEETLTWQYLINGKIATVLLFFAFVVITILFHSVVNLIEYYRNKKKS